LKNFYSTEHEPINVGEMIEGILGKPNKGEQMDKLANASVEGRKSQVGEQQNLLDKTIEELNGTAAILQDKLRSVTRDLPPLPEGDPAVDEELVPVASHIRDSRRSISNVIFCLQTISDTLEV